MLLLAIYNAEVNSMAHRIFGSIIGPDGVMNSSHILSLATSPVILESKFCSPLLLYLYCSLEMHCPALEHGELL